MSRTYRLIDGVNSNSRLEKLLLEKFTKDPFRKGYIEYEKNVLPVGYLTIADVIENFEVNDSDVWVVSCLKAGTTWTQEMVWLLAQDLNYKKAKTSLLERFPFLEMQSHIETYTEPGIPEHSRLSVSFCANKPEPRYIKTHLPWQLLPKQIRTGERKPKIVYVSRDPRDVVVSYFNHVCLLEGFRGNFDEFFDLFIADKIISTPFWPHVLDIWKERQRDNLLCIQYEDMQENLESVVLKVSEFLGKSYTADQLNGLLHHLSFQEMKKNPAVNMATATKVSVKVGLNTGGKEFMRSGKSGDFAAHLSNEQIVRMTEWCKTNTMGTDYPLKL